ncbi:MAG: glutamyl-tRNA reductase [Cellulomonadaceae bacterium]|nr:glutamyl-tRNA reductase [Cellulomonadaceae bacterium]
MVLTSLLASHHDLDLDVLEQLSTGAHSVAEQVVTDSPAVTGCVVLATCNRFEVYLDVTDPAALSDVTEVVARTSGLPHDDVVRALRARTGHEVVRHLFGVASGLDSMVVGEREVAGQVRRALEVARAGGTTSPTLERLFQTASRTSRAVGSSTGLGATGRSVVGVALDLVEHALHTDELTLADARVLLVGTGSYAGASLTALRARGVRDVAVHSPSGRADQFAAERGLRAVPAGGLAQDLGSADVVIACSGATGPVIDAAMVAEARAGSSPQRPTVVVDLALRHDVDPHVAGVPGVRLVDLATVQAAAPAIVLPAVEAGLRIVAEATDAFEQALAEQASVPAVLALREHVERLAAVEVERVGGAAAEAEVQRALRRFTAALLHTPSVAARTAAREGRDAEYRAALETVFGLDVPKD